MRSLVSLSKSFIGRVLLTGVVGAVVALVTPVLCL